MSKPPQKSGGPKRGSGGPNRGSGGSRGGPPRDGAPRGERPASPRGPRNPGDDRPHGGKARGEHSSGRPRGERDERRARPARPAPRSGYGPPKAATPKTPGLPEREGERIAKLLARAGVASRREAERMIAEGRVKLGDNVIDTPSTVLPDLRGVTVDGQPVKAPEATRLFAFHKPAGLITAERDPAGRPTIYTALRNALPPDAGRVIPIGRLDFNTEGLLLLTNDGGLKRLLELPATKVPRTYRARAFGDITQNQLEDLIDGIEIDGMHYGRIDANMERRTGRNQWIEMTITEGKNREVRRILEHFGLEVSRLIRVGYGPFALDELPKGMAVEIPRVEVEKFRKALEGRTA